MKNNIHSSLIYPSFFLPIVLIIITFTFSAFVNLSHAQTSAEENVIESAEEVGNIILNTTSEYVPESVENKATKLFNRMEKFRFEKRDQVAAWKASNYEQLTLERENTDGNTIVYLLKNILLSILLFVLSTAVVFYGLIIVLIFMILRRIWAVFFGSRYG